MQTNTDQKKVKGIQTAILAALCYVAFHYLQIRIPVPGGDATSLHIGNAFCVLGALLLGGVSGGLAGAIGMTIGDIMDPVYIVVAPKTFLLKFLIGCIAGYVAHRKGHISAHHDRPYLIRWSLIASLCSLGFNVLADPVTGYFYKRYLLGQPQQMAEALAKCTALATLINAVVSTLLVCVMYIAVRGPLMKYGLITDSEK